MMKFRSSLFIAALMFLGACSLYQSDGRKYMEKEASSVAGISAADNFQYCTEMTDSQPWVPWLETTEVVLLKNASESFELLVAPKNSNSHCQFLFSSEEELIKRWPSAEKISLQYLGLGEFSF